MKTTDTVRAAITTTDAARRNEQISARRRFFACHALIGRLAPNWARVRSPHRADIEVTLWGNDGFYAATPRGVGVFQTRGQRPQRCAVCFSHFDTTSPLPEGRRMRTGERHATKDNGETLVAIPFREYACEGPGFDVRGTGYLFAKDGRFHAACSDSCLASLASRAGLSLSIRRQDDRPADWDDFDGQALSAPELAGAHVELLADGSWARSAQPAQMMPRREMQSLAREWDLRDLHATQFRGKAEDLAHAMSTDELLAAAKTLGEEWTAMTAERRRLARAWTSGKDRSAAARKRGLECMTRIRDAEQTFRLVWAALGLRERMDADRAESASARQHFAEVLEGIEDNEVHDEPARRTRGNPARGRSLQDLRTAGIRI